MGIKKLRNDVISYICDGLDKAVKDAEFYINLNGYYENEWEYWDYGFHNGGSGSCKLAFEHMGEEVEC